MLALWPLFIRVAGCVIFRLSKLFSVSWQTTANRDGDFDGYDVSFKAGVSYRTIA
jgi:hypothetical protein